jgi:hypothetical protein
VGRRLLGTNLILIGVERRDAGQGGIPARPWRALNETGVHELRQPTFHRAGAGLQTLRQPADSRPAGGPILAQPDQFLVEKELRVSADRTLESLRFADGEGVAPSRSVGRAVLFPFFRRTAIRSCRGSRRDHGLLLCRSPLTFVVGVLHVSNQHGHGAAVVTTA